MTWGLTYFDQFTKLQMLHQHNFDKEFNRHSLDRFGFILSVESGLYPFENPDPDSLCLIMLLTLKALITTAADDKFCDIFANLKKIKHIS